MEETISLQDIFETIKKRTRLILFITLLAALISAIVSYFFITPIYQASTQILVNQSKSEQALYNNNEIQANLQLIDTYNVIIKSPAILDKVNKELKLGLSNEQLNGKISVNNEQNSQVVNITVQDPKPEQAAKIANKTAEVFQEEIVNIMNVDNVKILSEARVSEQQSPIKPKPVLNIAIALIAGLMMSVGLVFLIDYFDNTIKTEEDIEKVLQLPVLGMVSNFDRVKNKEVRNGRGGRNGS